MSISTRLAAPAPMAKTMLSAAYARLLRVAVVRNHPEGYVLASANAST
jgi:hypothetical protein